MGPIVDDNNISRGSVWGDFNNDGYLDLFIANSLNQNNSLYLNDGPPAFSFTKIEKGAIVTDSGDSFGLDWFPWSSAIFSQEYPFHRQHALREVQVQVTLTTSVP